MYLWLVPNEIRPYLGRTFTIMPRGIVKVQNRRWSIPQICFDTVANWNQRLHIFSQFSLIVLIIISHSTPIDIRHHVLALAHEGMWQSVIDGRMGVTRATMNHILWRHAATVTLVSGKSTGGSLEDHTSSRPCFVEDGPTGSLLKCLGIDGMDEEFVLNEGWPENINNRFLSLGCHAYRPTRKPLLTANHCRLLLENLTMVHWHLWRWSPDSNFAW